MNIDYKISVNLHILPPDQLETFLIGLAQELSVTVDLLKRNIFDDVLELVISTNQITVRKVSAYLFNMNMEPRITTLNRFQNKFVDDIDNSTIDDLLVERVDKAGRVKIGHIRNAQDHSFANPLRHRMEDKIQRQQLEKHTLKFDRNALKEVAKKPKVQREEPQMAVTGISFQPVDTSRNKTKSQTLPSYHHKSELKVDKEFAAKLMPNSSLKKSEDISTNVSMSSPNASSNLNPHSNIDIQNNHITVNMVYQGKFENISLAQALENFAQIFKKNVVEITPFFDGKAHILKQNISLSDAQTYQQFFKSKGLILEITPNVPK